MNNTSDYTNYTLFGLEDDVVRYVWAGWTLIVLLSSVLGDTIILVATIKYRAIKLHDITVMFIQHIAVCDLVLSVTYIFPGLVSLLTDKWVLGVIFCNITAYSSHFFFPVGCFLVCGMTTGKLLLLHCPLKARIWSSSQAHKVCTGIWLFCLTLPITQYLFAKDDAVFDLRKYNCTYGFFADVWRWLKPISFLVMGSVPSVTIIVATGLLFKKAREITKATLRWRGSITLILVATAYSVAILPYNLWGLIASFLEKDTVSSHQLEWYRFSCTLLSINVMANFFIYSLTVRSFRTFLNDMSSKMMPCFVQPTPAQYKVYVMFF